MSTYVIYETASVHGGDPVRLFDLADQLDPGEREPRKGLKFHTIAAETLALPSFPYFNVYRELEIPNGKWRDIIARAARSFDVWLEMADANCVAVFADNRDKVFGVKLQASMLQNEEVLGLLQGANLAGTQLLANVSGFEISEIERILVRLAEVGFSRADTTLQVGFQSYPTAVEDCQLNKISILRAAFPDTRIGIADHLSATDPYALVLPAVACALGCKSVEKHVCLSRGETEYDAMSALEPSEVLVMEQNLQAVASSFSPEFITSAEKSYLASSLLMPCCAGEKREGALVGTRDMIFRRQGGAPLSQDQICDWQGEGQVLAHAHCRGDAFLKTSFRPARVAAVIACRMKSTRLQNKALLPLGGQPMIERCIENCLRIRRVDAVYLATSTLDQDAVLETATRNTGCGFFQGDPDDVMMRYLDLARAEGIDVIVRVTGDNPVVSPEIADFLLEDHFRMGADFTRADNDAVGTGAHIINVEAMHRVVEGLGSAPMSEYMNWYFENNPELFSVNIVTLPPHLVRDYRLTMDYQEDYDLFAALFEQLEQAGLPHTLENVFSILDRQPELAGSNTRMLVKYQSDEDLIQELKLKTRLPGGSDREAVRPDQDP